MTSPEISEIILFLLIPNSMLQVTFTEGNASLLHFLTNLCAIVGGTATIGTFLLVQPNK